MDKRKKSAAKPEQKMPGVRFNSQETILKPALKKKRVEKEAKKEQQSQASNNPPPILSQAISSQTSFSGLRTRLASSFNNSS